MKTLGVALLLALGSSSPLLLNNRIEEPAEENEEIKYNLKTSNVMYDLHQMEEFDDKDYNPKFDDFRLINLIEYQYNQYSSIDYGVYVYFYLNTNKEIYDLRAVFIKDYENGYVDGNLLGSFDLDIVSQEGHFYKCKIENYIPLYDSVKGSEDREYNLFRIHYQYKLNTILGKRAFEANYDPNAQFVYSGSCKSSEHESTLTCHYIDDYKYRVDVDVQSYLTDDSYGVRNELFYAYFSIPETFLTDYGELQAVEYSYDYVLSQPIFLIKKSFNKDNINITLGNNLAVKLANDLAFNGIPSNCSDLFSKAMNGESVSLNDYKGSSVNRVGDISSMQKIVKDYYQSNVSGSEILSMIKSNAFMHGYDKHVHEIKSDSEFNFSSPEYDFHPVVNNIVSGMLGLDTESTTHFQNLHVIQKIDSNDLNLSKESFESKYCVDDEYISGMKVSASLDYDDGLVPYLFRFTTGSHGSMNIYCSDTNIFGYDPCGRFILADAILNFEVLTFNFKNDKDISIIPVAANPIDYAHDAIPSTYNNTVAQDAFIILRIVLIIALIAVILFLFFKFILPLIVKSSKKKGA